jgi:undecaprenyl-diphosphatase
VLPVSSSGHFALLPRLLGWDYAELPGDTRKSFEVALHAGSAPVLAAAALHSRRRAGEPIDLTDLALTVAPAAMAGFALERPIEERLGGVRSAAVAQLAAGVGLLIADRRPAGRAAAATMDHLAVGLAQAIALIPGVSRAGAALTAARIRGLSRPAAVRLSLSGAVPVTLAAVALKGMRAVADPPRERGARAPALAGAAAAFASSFASLPLVTRLERARSFKPLAAYRIALGAAALAAERRAAARALPTPDRSA